MLHTKGFERLAIGIRVLVALEKAVAMSYHRKRDTVSCSPETAHEHANWHPETGAPVWFALAVKPRHDKVVAKTLEAKGFQTFLPLYTKRQEYASRRKNSELPLFPGYVFCRFNALRRLPILTTPGVTQILGVGNMPIPISETEIASLQIAIKAQLLVQPFPFLQVGRRVRIHKGVLAGVEGIVMGSKQCLRLVLSVTLLQRSVLLEIDRDHVTAEEVL